MGESGWGERDLGEAAPNDAEFSRRGNGQDKDTPG